MWTPSDKNAIPTAYDIVKAKESIRTLEENLNDAQIQIRQLTGEMEFLRAWMAPVRRLPVEILSPIFILGSKMLWKVPLSIAAVCRRWREIILDTPEAWFFLKVRNQYGVHLIGLYLERSKQRLLHLALRKSVDVLKLTPHVHGLESIQLPDLPESMESIHFPYLKSLRVTSETSKVRFVQVTRSQFPSLCHLEVAGMFTDRWDAPSVSFPPVQSLTITLRENGKPGILRRLKDTLTSLDAYLVSVPFLASNHPVHLPQLRCLTLRRYTNGVDLPIQLVTPLLTTYIQMNAFHTSNLLIHKDVKTVTHLRCRTYQWPATFEQVRVLQLSIAAYEVDYALMALQDCDKFPQLKVVEFCLASQYKGMTIFDDWIRKHRPSLCVIVTIRNWTINLPGTIESWAPWPYYVGVFVTPPEIPYPG